MPANTGRLLQKGRPSGSALLSLPAQHGSAPASSSARHLSCPPIQRRPSERPHSSGGTCEGKHRQNQTSSSFKVTAAAVAAAASDGGSDAILHHAQPEAPWTDQQPQAARGGKRSPGSDCEVVPDTPTSSCGRAGAPAGGSLARAALQRAAAQLPVHSPQLPAAASLQRLGSAEEFESIPETAPAPDDSPCKQQRGQQVVEALGADARPAQRYAETISHTGRAAELPVVAPMQLDLAPPYPKQEQASPVQAGAKSAGVLADMSPFDAKMLAHLDKINQKALAMAVRSIHTAVTFSLIQRNLAGWYSHAERCLHLQHMRTILQMHRSGQLNRVLCGARGLLQKVRH